MGAAGRSSARPAAAIPGGLTLMEDAVMSIGGSIALIVIGAILRFAVTWKPRYVNLESVGVILMIGGAAGLAVALAFLISRRRSRASADVYEQRRYVEPPP